jgi:ABC-type multidrug transport system fused ATPase/permease subunit
VAALRFFVLLMTGVGMARRLHSKMLYRVFHSEVESFLEKIPLGSILNRFTKDLNIIDKEVMHNISDMTF